MTDFKLGKLPARNGAVKLKLSTYLDSTLLPPIPAEFGHEKLIGSWGMLGNDRVGDCVIAGGLHETLLWNAEASRVVHLDDAAAIRNYSVITGYNPSDPSTDRGTDMEAAANYRRKYGLVDANGRRHRIGAYVALTPGDIGELWAATYLFDGVGIGVDFPSQWMDAFNQARPWDRVAHPKSEGGHYVTSVCKRQGMAGVVTWGRVQAMTAAGYRQFNDESIAYLSVEKLADGRTLEGLDLNALRADLIALTQGA